MVIWNLYFGLFGWPLKTLLLKLIQQWLVGRFEGLGRGYLPSKNIFEIPSSFWAIALRLNLHLGMEFGLCWGCLEAGVEFLGFIFSSKVERLPMWSLMTWISVLREIFINVSPLAINFRTLYYGFIFLNSLKRFAFWYASSIMHSHY